MSTIIRQPLRKAHGTFAVLLSFLLTMAGGAPAQATVNIANAPLFLSPSIEPNIMFIIDDSGSMQWETMPDELTNMFIQGCCANYMMWMYPRTDGLHGAGDYGNGFRVPSFTNTSIMGRAFRSSLVNTVYYNPAITYRPWVNADGSDMPPANPAAAPNRPLFPGFGTRNLTANNTQTARWVENRANLHVEEERTFYPAVYSTYIGPAIPNVLAAIADAGSPLWVNANYTLTEIRDTTPTYTGEGRGSRTDCDNATVNPPDPNHIPSCTYDEEIQNFANWYTYHRNRIFTARGGIGRAFVDFGAEMRVGYARINTNENTVDNVAGRAVVRGVRLFEGAPKTAFFNSLYTDPIPAQGTPLRRALDGAGQYFSRTDARGPWSTTPGAAGGDDLTCRQSFSILMTDGYTSGGDANRAYHADRRANTDGSNAQNTTNVHPDDASLNYTYAPADPYRDNRDNTLADVAMYYWKRDLRPDLANRVPTSNRNTAFWQHMVTYGVGLGVAGSIDPAAAWQAVAKPNEPPTPIAWPDPAFGTTNCGDGPAGTCAARVDDLLHAAVNSRGGFFSAADPETFAAELRGVLEDIVGRVESSSTSAAASAAVLQTDTLLYTAGFRSDDWSGTLKAYELTEDGVDNLDIYQWDAEAKLAARSPATRKIFTRKAVAVTSGSGGGVSFEDLGDLEPPQQAALNHNPNNVADNLGQERVDWLRGTEQASFRSRCVSPDPVNDPADPDHPLYDNCPDTPSIPPKKQKQRPLGDIIHSDPQYKNDVLYLGANDGMLHAFDALTGEELFAYIPSPLLLPEPDRDHAPLSRLMDPNYTHRYFVDGKAVVADVTIDGSAKTYLVGSMGAGGRTVFALDVTNPSGFSASDVKWEFSHPELGYNVGQPAIVRMSDGTWAAVFGNGYNSNSHKAALFVVNLKTGALMGVDPIDTGVGAAGTPNGLAAPFVTDWPEMNLRAQRIYAGDLLGNLWAFDVSKNDPNDWTSRKLFEARDASNNPQPITSNPYGAKIGEDRVMIVFGTGSYFRIPDATDTQVQSLYGIVDYLVPANNPVDRSEDLLMQEIIHQGSATFGDPPVTYTVRVLSDYVSDPDDPKEGGWFIDLIYLNTETGERVVSGPVTLGHAEQRVRFTTMIPDEDPCTPGRRGFLMDIDLLTGGRMDFSVFDLDGDSRFDMDEHGTPNTSDQVTVTLPDGTQVTIPASGIGFGSGEAIAVIAVPEPSSNLEPYDLICDGEGNCEKGRPDDLTGGRQSWRQLR